VEGTIDSIATLAATYPDAAERVVLRLISDEDRAPCFAIFCESIGVECAKLLFDSLPEYAWRSIDSPFRAAIPAAKALEIFAKELLNECMAEPEGTTENPFAFLSGMPDERVARLLAGFPVERVALIGMFRKRDDIARIARALGPAGAKRLIVTISRLHRIPRSALLKQARQFSDELLDRIEAELPVKAAPADTVTELDRAIAAIDLDREVEVLAAAQGRSQLLDDLIRAMPSSEPIRSIVESARQKLSS
jgi:hypothetical protein